MKTKVTGAFVIGYDGNDHVIYPNGELVYEGDTILFVGHNYTEPVDEIIDGGLCLVSPGFIDLDALCPLTSVRYAHALDTFDRYRHAGVNIALGSDSFPPDLIRGMDYGNNITKLLTGDKSAGHAAAYFRAATLGGAQALGRDDLGRLAPGAKADLILVDFSKLRTGPIDDPIRTLLMNSGGADVQTVIINGRIVMRDGVIPGVDVDDLKARGQAYFAKLKGAYPERDYQQRPVDELFPPSFPIIKRMV